MPSPSSTSPRALTSSLNKLNMTSQPADSWEDEADDDLPTTSTSTLTAPGTITPPVPRPDSSSDHPRAPPPTPSSPSLARRQHPPTNSYADDPRFNPIFEDSSSNVPSNRNLDSQKRPETSTAVASRLIAAGIGQKAPKRTQEQKEYDAAMKVQEKKRREAAREEEARGKREVEEKKRAVWED